jgi:ATP-dependent DNA helicase RecQ
MNSPEAILKSYWGFDQFRPKQREIIQSVLDGNDTLTLLPTGGGKSVCFQIPGLILPGLTVVVSPLIALIKDQVFQLKKKGIAAEALHTGMSKREIDISLDNCVNSEVKFLYLSPERLKAEIVITRLKIVAEKRGVDLVAVDEAHCISQWGYDFRPSYLEIAAIREHLPKAVFIALTATATPEVKKDIQEQLLFDQGKVFTDSFARENLSYSVRFEEHKDRKLVEILQKVRGSAVVYVSTRRKTKEIAALLTRHRISADFYHAGVNIEERNAKQDNWIHGRLRVIVSTNAFGMGIDKADVRSVIHMDIPQNLESYYQEAGRVGRDGKKAFGVIICNQKDVDDMRVKTMQSLPEESLLRSIYQMFGNHFQLAIGSHPLESLNFDFEAFTRHFDQKFIEIFHGIKSLESQGFILMTESFYQPSKILFSLNHKALYEFQIANGIYDAIIKGLLRLYGGELYNSPVQIKESGLSALLGITISECVAQLNQLAEREVLEYFQQKDKPQLTMLLPRVAADKLPIDKKKLNNRRKLTLKKMESVISYLHNEDRCRTQQILEYFGEVSYDKCDVCDTCIRNKKRDMDDDLKSHYRKQIENTLHESVDLDLQQLIKILLPEDKDLFSELISEMLDHGIVYYDDFGKLKPSK